MSGFPLQQLVVEVCMDIVYMITGGRSWQKFHDLVCRKLQKQQTYYFIMIVASVHFMLAHLPNFSSISDVSFAAAIMSFRRKRCAIWCGIWLQCFYYCRKSFQPSSAPCETSLLLMLVTMWFWTSKLQFLLRLRSLPMDPCGESLLMPTLCCRFVLLPCCSYRLLDVWEWSPGHILISLEKPTWLIATANFLLSFTLLEAIR